MDPQRPVRLPGERGYQLAATQAEAGVLLPALAPWAAKFGVPLP